MSEIKEIPGFYYDEERKRYFKITNGAIPGSSSSSSSSSLSKYHNNSVQAEQRKKQAATTKTPKRAGSSKEIIKNPQLLKLPARLQSKFLTPSTSKLTRFTYTPSGLINLKTGSSPVKSDLLQARLSSVPKIEPKHIPLLTPRGFVLELVKDHLVISRIGLVSETLETTGYEYHPRALVLQHATDGTITESAHDWHVAAGVNVQNVELAAIHDAVWADDTRTDVFHEVLDGCGEVVVVSLYTHFAEGVGNCFVRFNGIDTKKDNPVNHDYSAQFTGFIWSRIRLLPSSTKEQLERAFGLPLCLNMEELDEPSVSEVNEMMMSRESTLRSIAPTSDLMLREAIKAKKLKDFLLAKEIASLGDDVLIYRCEKYDNPRGARILDCKISKQDNSFHFLVSTGSLVSFKYNGAGKFTKFKHVQVAKNFPPTSLLCVFDTVRVIRAGSKLTLVDSEGKTRQLEGRYNYMRKMFLISWRELILVLKDSIVLWNIETNEKETVLKYMNDNDANQQFEMFGSYLVYNVGDTIHFVNVHTNESWSVGLEFRFRRCGYLMNFNLVKIIKLGEINTRLHLGFTFLNTEDMTTIFETYLV
ncbi:hypothetical protein Cantr_10736 [Candida viswanathii]|uniref:Uncharacterized protein n=1 Tax=Candida viswanathii TaxID=5486 RepID=A0A367YD57_9ASCO|nr:hypothetical protein Cantr_10736 [Candida viswanathii]